MKNLFFIAFCVFLLSACESNVDPEKACKICKEQYPEDCQTSPEKEQCFKKCQPFITKNQLDEFLQCYQDCQ